MSFRPFVLRSDEQNTLTRRCERIERQLESFERDLERAIASGDDDEATRLVGIIESLDADLSELRWGW